MPHGPTFARSVFMLLHNIGWHTLMSAVHIHIEGMRVKDQFDNVNDDDDGCIIDTQIRVHILLTTTGDG